MLHDITTCSLHDKMAEFVHLPTRILAAWSAQHTYHQEHQRFPAILTVKKTKGFTELCSLVDHGTKEQTTSFVNV